MKSKLVCESLNEFMDPAHMARKDFLKHAQHNGGTSFKQWLEKNYSTEIDSIVNSLFKMGERATQFDDYSVLFDLPYEVFLGDEPESMMQTWVDDVLEMINSGDL